MDQYSLMFNGANLNVVLQKKRKMIIKESVCINKIR